MGKQRDIADSAAVINYLDGTTSSVQTQLDAKAPTASPTFTGTATMDGLTVDGDASISSSNARLRLFETDTTDLNTQLQNSGGDFFIKTLVDDASTSTTRFTIDHATGDISFYEDTGTTAKFFWDASAEALGIGTSSPTETLMVSGTGSQYIRLQSTDGSGSGVYLGNSGSSDRRITLDNANLKFENNDGSAEYMRIDSSGNVGIGNTSPTEKLDVTGTVKATNYTDTVYALSGTALDPANGGIQTKTLAANTTFTDSLASGESLVLQLEAGASYTVTWPTMTWVTSGGNVAPTLTAADTLVFWKVSTTLYGAYTGSYV